MFHAYKVLFSIYVGIYKVGPSWFIKSSFLKLIRSLSVYFENAIYCNTWKEASNYKVLPLSFVCYILDLGMSVFTY
jgi:hypothetical protein